MIFRKYEEVRAMADSSTPWKSWHLLGGLHPQAIELSRVALIHSASQADLSDPTKLESLLLELGLNDEALHEFPERLRPYCGKGLRIWQYPSQFGAYLRKLSTLQVRSYLGIGIRHGGSFVATVEILGKFTRLEHALAVDIIPCPSLVEYQQLNPRIDVAWINTQSSMFEELVSGLGRIDLVFIDSHHEESQCRREFQSVKAAAAMVAFHDIANRDCPGVGKVWAEIKASGEYDCHEFTQQYQDDASYMGIGLAIVRQGEGACTEMRGNA
jgi:cephalosporin hydroxylase